MKKAKEITDSVLSIGLQKTAEEYYLTVKEVIKIVEPFIEIDSSLYIK